MYQGYLNFKNWITERERERERERVFPTRDKFISLQYILSTRFLVHTSTKLFTTPIVGRRIYKAAPLNILTSSRMIYFTMRIFSVSMCSVFLSVLRLSVRPSVCSSLSSEPYILSMNSWTSVNTQFCMLVG